ncbi:hypothetical protein BST96_12680 [Oceanicoccus sagamiensis]|uniref:Uncharacterized protein n=2 Tax=Oceanicoccus sagamiensis TaxID=716816 RepID=A0A1X9NGB2_9GAMM|nr:hypothetical protein BST96_12680 [Oceanicoccus sagamiensis]
MPVELDESPEGDLICQFPNAKKLGGDKDELYVLEGFLDADECELLIKKIRGGRIKQQKSNAEYQADSNNLGLEIVPLNQSDSISKVVDDRIKEYMGVTVSEPVNIVGHYLAPELHQNETLNGTNDTAGWFYTVHLNNVEEGGATKFVTASTGEIVISAKAGQAVFWRGSSDDIQYQEQSVTTGEKFIISKQWPGFSDKFKPHLHKYIPAFTEIGFEKFQVPSEIYQKIKAFYQSNKHLEIDEKLGKRLTSIKKNHPSSYLELPDVLRQEMIDTLAPMFEQWSGQKLLITSIYGVRSYKKGANLSMHVDRYRTHIISAIINVDQAVTKKWPLHAYDHFGRLHRIYLKPGEMIFYESARVPHGRPTPLNGKNFANLFIHAQPVGWQLYEKALTKLILNKTAVEQVVF